MGIKKIKFSKDDENRRKESIDSLMPSKISYV